MRSDTISPEDMELLVLAGKAANIPPLVIGASGSMYWIEETHSCHDSWNPLISDRDALRLAVTLAMINPGCFPRPSEHLDLDNPDWYAATRRAIVVAAARIGATMR
jgi:hypothetical protein